MSVLLTNSRSLKIPGVQKVRSEVDSVILLEESGLKSLAGLRKIHSINCKRIYIAHDNPYLLCLIVIYISLFKRKKITLFFQELYDVYKRLFTVLKKTLKMVDQIIVPSYNRKVATELLYGYNGTVLILPNKRDPENSAQSINGADQFGYVYTGVLYPERDILKGIETIQQVVDIFGSGNSEYIKKLSQSSKTQFMGGFEQKDEIEIVLKYKVGILYYPMNSINNTLCSPNKFFTYRDLGLSIHCESPNAFKSLIIYNTIRNSNVKKID